MDDFFPLSEDEQLKIFNRIYQEITKGKTPDIKNLQCQLILGLPGSGKSTFAQKQSQEISFVHLDSDAFLNYHPVIKTLMQIYPQRLNGKDSSSLAEDPEIYQFVENAFYYLDDRLERKGYSIVVDALLGGEIVDYASEKAMAGYKTDVTLISVPKPILDCNIVERFFNNRKQEVYHPRAVLRLPPELLKDFDLDLDYLAEKQLPITVRNGDGKILYQDNGQTEECQAAEFFWQEYHRELSTKEKIELNKRQYRLMAQAQTPYERAVVRGLNLDGAKNIYSANNHGQFR